jgi:hypothetical protein
MSDEVPKPRKNFHEPSDQPAVYTAPAWLSPQEIESELLSAAITD